VFSHTLTGRCGRDAIPKCTDFVAVTVAGNA
jgi:hypothetical protein